MRNTVIGMLGAGVVACNVSGEMNNKHLEQLDQLNQLNQIVQLKELVVDTREKVFITIDDGPSPYTRQILKTLDSLGHKATFFLVGESIKADDMPMLQQAVQNGHEIGNHSYAHRNFKAMNLEQAKSDVQHVDSLLTPLFQGKSKYFRYPYGAEVKKGLQLDFNAFLESLGYQKHVFRDLDTRDRDVRTTSDRLKAYLSQIKPGDVILIHERKRTATETLIVIDSLLKAKNLRAAPLSQKDDVQSTSFGTPAQKTSAQK